MVKCALKSCGITSHAIRNLPDSIRLHRFPKDEAMRKCWMQFSDRADLANAKDAYLCSKHFVRQDYENIYMEGARKILRKNAVPSIREPHTEDQSDCGSRQDRSEIVSGLLREHEQSVAQYPLLKVEELDMPVSPVRIEDSNDGRFSSKEGVYAVDKGKWESWDDFLLKRLD
ncbi:hypothetical protein RP20_CCG002686 [Aedes albopictus]|nr:hypothetical protein RP20_CCG002686 [Aedes albopictus]